jgi:hypothetical protein
VPKRRTKADKEESSVEGASTTEMVLETENQQCKRRRKETRQIEMMKMEAEHAWKNLEKEPINIEAKKRRQKIHGRISTRYYRLTKKTMQNVASKIMIVTTMIL